MPKSIRFWITVAIALLVIAVAGGIWYTQRDQSAHLSPIVLPRGVRWGLTLAHVKTQATTQRVSYFEVETPDRLIYKAALATYPAVLMLHVG